MNQQTLDFMAIYPWIDKCFYQYFDDSWEKRQSLTGFWNYLTESSLSILESLNKQWAWIFFSVNWFEGDRRKKEDVKHINAWICEIDWMDKEFQKQLIEFCPLQPSLFIESKNGFHLYRFATEWTTDNRAKICNWIRNFFDWDHKAITIERVLRLPWFNHLKDPNNPFEVTMVWWDWAYHTESEMLFFYSNTESVSDKKEKKQELKHQISQYKDDDNFRDRASKLDNRKMLEALSWSSYVSWETITFKRNSWWCEQIFVNNKSTSSWIDKQGMIWSHDKWWPTRIQRVNRYWVADYKQLYQFIIWLFPDLKKKDKLSTKKEDISKKIESLDSIVDDYLTSYDRDFKTDYNTIIPYTRGTEWLDNRFGRINNWMFITTLWESWSGKTTFAFNQLLQISKKYKVLFVSLEMTGERVIELRARKMAWITKKQWSDKSFASYQMENMQRHIDDIKSNSNLQIVGINNNSETIDIDLILKSILTKYSDYDFITIDNLWFIKADSQKQEQRMTDYQEANYIIRQIKKFCQTHKKTINLLHHFNKWNWTRKDRTFADVMMTAKLEHDIDYWIFITRPVFEPRDYEEASQQDRATVYVDLQKDRDTGEKLRHLIYFDKWWYSDTFNS